MSNASASFLSTIVQSSDLVVRPDHPLLLRGPEALVGGDSNLCAIFIPQAIELNNPAHLASRLISSRLALPRHCRTLLILSKENEERFEGLKRDFGLITNKADRSLPTFLRDRNDFGKSAPMDAAVQQRAGQLFDLSLSVTAYSFRLSRTKSRPLALPSKADYWRSAAQQKITSGPFEYSPRNRFMFGGSSVSVLAARRRSTLARQITVASSGHLLECYVLDNGVPYPRALKSHLAIAERADDLFTLRSKAIHATAYAGISIVPTEDAHVVDAALERASNADVVLG